MESEESKLEKSVSGKKAFNPLKKMAKKYILPVATVASMTLSGCMCPNNKPVYIPEEMGCEKVITDAPSETKDEKSSKEHTLELLKNYDWIVDSETIGNESEIKEKARTLSLYTHDPHYKEAIKKYTVCIDKKVFETSDLTYIASHLRKCEGSPDWNEKSATWSKELNNLYKTVYYSLMWDPGKSELEKALAEQGIEEVKVEKETHPEGKAGAYLGVGLKAIGLLMIGGGIAAFFSGEDGIDVAGFLVPNSIFPLMLGAYVHGATQQSAKEALDFELSHLERTTLEDTSKPSGIQTYVNEGQKTSQEQDSVIQVSQDLGYVLDDSTKTAYVVPFKK
ncbi:MAG: hypothetical protein ACQESC_03535 [Nanobdellota archaeon]